MKRNPIHKVYSGEWSHAIGETLVHRHKSWGFTCPQCGTEFKRELHGSPWRSRKSAKDALHAHITGKGTRIVCQGGLVDTVTG